MKISRGPAYAIASATLFGGSTAAAKALLGDVNPIILAGLLYLGSGIGLALLMGIGRIAGVGAITLRLARRDIPSLAGAIASGGVAAPILFMWGLSRTSASAVSLLLNLEGVLTVFLAWAVFHENFGRRAVFGLILVVSGALLLSISPGTGGRTGLLGILTVVAASFAWAVDNNLTRRVSAGNPAAIAGMKGLFAGTVTLVIARALGHPLPGPGLVLTACVVGLLGYGVSIALFVLSLRNIGAARTGTFYSTAPFIGALASLVFLGEPAGVLLMPVAVLMALGVWLQISEEHAHLHRHEPVTHDHPHQHDDRHHAHDHPEALSSKSRHSHPHTHDEKEHDHVHYPDSHHSHRHRKR